jgi:hypothetical protein
MDVISKNRNVVKEKKMKKKTKNFNVSNQKKET